METNPALINSAVVKEGFIKKRNGRLRQWTDRYFVLSTSTIAYKVKQDAPNFRQTFDLSPGCLVTEVTPESRVGGKKLYSFWVVWPHEKKGEKGEKKDDSDDEHEHVNKSEDESNKPKMKDLKHVVEQEKLAHERQKEIVAEQVELHQQYDSSVSMGAKVAAVAVGGVVVGALTAGIGLVPYFTIVGITAAASGGAMAFSFRRPMDSRLIMACDNMKDASDWKEAIERQIALVTDKLKPALPVDPNVISTILDRSAQGGEWKRVREVEGIRVVEHVIADGLGCKTRCRRGQIVVGSTCNEAFLAIMNAKLWPKQGTFQVVKQVDDHLDYIGVEWPLSLRPPYPEARRLCLSRFWQLDDEGVYMISYHTASTVEYPHMVRKTKNSEFILCPQDSLPTIDAVVTLAPPYNQESYSFELSEALLTCSVQLTDPKGLWSGKESALFMDDFICDILLEVKQMLMYSRYDLQYSNGVIVQCPPNVNNTSMSNIGSMGERSSSRKKFESVKIDGVKGEGGKSLAKRGVTTVQPGMEDMVGDDGHSHGEKMKRPGRLMRMFTRKKEGLDTHPTADNHASSPPDDVPPSSPDVPIRKSLTRSNAEATRLRREIDTAEYELQRLSKALKKANTTPSATDPSVPPPPSSPRNSSIKGGQNYQELNEGVYAVQTRLFTLKGEYLQLMGESYEQSRGGRGTLSRWRSLRKGRGEGKDQEESTSDSHNPEALRQAWAGGGSGSSQGGSGNPLPLLASPETSVVAGRGVPSHWFPPDYGSRKSPSAVNLLLQLLRSMNFWSTLQQLFLPSKSRPFLIRLLRDYDGSAVFFCSANFVTLLGLLLACAAMMGVNWIVAVVLGV